MVNEIEVSELLQQLSENSATLRLVDVRSQEEIMRGKIPGAEAVPLHLLPIKCQEFKQDENVLFYCATGARSAQACLFMQQQGHHRVYNLRGGIRAWALSGQEVA